MDIIGPLSSLDCLSLLALAPLLPGLLSTWHVTFAHPLLGQCVLLSQKTGYERAVFTIPFLSV